MPQVGSDRLSRAAVLSLARRVVRTEARALAQVAGRLDRGFVAITDLIAECSGRLAVCGVGKSADVARKAVATFNSTGTRAYFLDATSALHGDLGGIHPDDLALFFSHSGETAEILRLLPFIQASCAGIAAVTSRPSSTLARACQAVCAYGLVDEADPLGLAPSTSTTVMLALADALAFSLCGMRAFSADDFARNHPAGNLGRRLATVESVMRSGPALRIACKHETVRSVFAAAAHVGRRTGAVMLVDGHDRLTGICTDSDLARLIESRREHLLDRPICEVMTPNPRYVVLPCKLTDAVGLMRRHKLSELPVLDAEHRPVGLLDITDLLDQASMVEYGSESR